MEKVGSCALRIRPLSPDEIEARLRLEGVTPLKLRMLFEGQLSQSIQGFRRASMASGLVRREARAGVTERKRLKDLRCCQKLTRY